MDQVLVCFCGMRVTQAQQALQVPVEGSNPLDRCHLGQLAHIGAGDLLHHCCPVTLSIVRSPLVSFCGNEIDMLVDLLNRNVRMALLDNEHFTGELQACDQRMLHGRWAAQADRKGLRGSSCRSEALRHRDAPDVCTESAVLRLYRLSI